MVLLWRIFLVRGDTCVWLHLEAGTYVYLMVQRTSIVIKLWMGILKSTQDYCKKVWFATAWKHDSPSFLQTPPKQCLINRNAWEAKTQRGLLTCLLYIHGSPFLQPGAAWGCGHESHRHFSSKKTKLSGTDWSLWSFASLLKFASRVISVHPPVKYLMFFDLFCCPSHGFHQVARLHNRPLRANLPRARAAMQTNLPGGPL